LVEEMKKLVSDIIVSGLIWPPDEQETARKDDPSNSPESEIKTSRRYELSKRAWSLYHAVRQVEGQRTYQIPPPIAALRYYDKYEIIKSGSGDAQKSETTAEIWRVYDLDIVTEMTDLKNANRSLALMDWMDYYINAIDFLTRTMQEPTEVKRAKKSKSYKISPNK
jgi:hypothetical protein